MQNWVYVLKQTSALNEVNDWALNLDINQVHTNLLALLRTELKLTYNFVYMVNDDFINGRGNKACKLVGLPHAEKPLKIC